MSTTVLSDAMQFCFMLNLRADRTMRHCGILRRHVKRFTCLAVRGPASTSVPQVEQALCRLSRLLFIAHFGLRPGDCTHCSRIRMQMPTCMSTSLCLQSLGELLLFRNHFNRPCSEDSKPTPVEKLALQHPSGHACEHHDKLKA